MGDAAQGAKIKSVDEFGPFYDAGFEAGCIVLSVDGEPLRDLIDWQWFADGDAILVEYLDTSGDRGSIEVVRDEGEPWGVEFDDVIFDEVITCRNACTFCFMRMLPDGMRSSLALRDDDYRLSFLQGNFVTFTNVDDAALHRIIEQRISPLRFSLHAVDEDVREKVIGKHAAQGLSVAQRLLEAGIDLHAQIVLMPGVNDGAVLKRTLTWAYERPGVKTVGIVPVGYTKHQEAFAKSFGKPREAQRVLDTVEPFARRARNERGFDWVFCSDEFYRNAYPETLLEHLPRAERYGDFDMFEDGIGIIRSFVDDWNASIGSQERLAIALKEQGKRVALVCGLAQREFLDELLRQSPLAGLLVPLYVPNDYFGGNVDVTGLLCGCDIASALAKAADEFAFAAIPNVVFNADGVTLDDMTPEGIKRNSRMGVRVVSCQASEYLSQIADELERG